MAVIHFTDADVMVTTTVAASIYPSEVSKIDGPKKSSSGKSNSIFVDITITDGPYKGKTRTVVFNDETGSPSILGEMQFYPQAYMLQLFAATENGKPSAGPRDTDNLLHKPFDAVWGVHTVEGRIINVINGFHPAGYGKDTPTF